MQANSQRGIESHANGRDGQARRVEQVLIFAADDGPIACSVGAYLQRRGAIEASSGVLVESSAICSHIDASIVALPLSRPADHDVGHTSAVD